MMTKPELDRLERIATQILAGLRANPEPRAIEMTRERAAQVCIAQAQELIKQLDALAEAE